MNAAAPITPASLRARFAQMVTAEELERTDEDYRKARPKVATTREAGLFNLAFWEKQIERIEANQLPLSPPGTFKKAAKRPVDARARAATTSPNPARARSTTLTKTPAFPKPQKNRHVKLVCTYISGKKGSTDVRFCGFHVRMSRKMLAVYGAPLCPRHPTRPMDIAS